MKKYLGFFTMNFKSGLQYRAAAWAGVATQFAWGGMRILLFYILYKENPSSFPMEFSQLCTYLWVQQAFVRIFSVLSLDEEILNSVVTGGVAYELCRPTDTYFMWMSRDMGKRISGALMRCPFILMFAFFLPQPFNLSLPAGGILTFLIFIFSMALGCILTTSFTMLIYIFSFKAVSSQGIRAIFLCVTELLMGQIIPIAFFPETIKPLMYVLPFASLQNTPLMIYCGGISGSEMVYSLGLQLIWASVIILFGRLLMKRMSKKITVQGG